MESVCISPFALVEESVLVAAGAPEVTWLTLCVRVPEPELVDDMEDVEVVAFAMGVPEAEGTAEDPLIKEPVPHGMDAPSG